MNLVRTPAAGFMFFITIWDHYTPSMKLLNKQLMLLKTPSSTAVRVLKEFLKEAAPCYKTYPSVYYYFAFLAFSEINWKEFKEYYEQGQDAEEKRLPFLDPVDIPLKDTMSTFYQLFGNV